MLPLNSRVRHMGGIDQSRRDFDAMGQNFLGILSFSLEPSAGRGSSKSALAALFAMLLASCALVEENELQRSADAVAGSVAEAGAFFEICDKMSDGCERWAVSFVQIAGESMYALSSSAKTRGALSDTGVVTACAGVSALIESSLGTDRQILLRQASFAHVRNEAIKLHEQLGEEVRRRRMSPRECH
jgi:hypothetical protein